jgi:hypothetical protein
MHDGWSLVYTRLDRILGNRSDVIGNYAAARTERTKPYGTSLCTMTVDQWNISAIMHRARLEPFETRRIVSLNIAAK